MWLDATVSFCCGSIGLSSLVIVKLLSKNQFNYLIQSNFVIKCKVICWFGFFLSTLSLDAFNNLESSIFINLQFSLLIFPSVLIFFLHFLMWTPSRNFSSHKFGELLPNVNYKEQWFILVLCEVSFNTALFIHYGSPVWLNVFTSVAVWK